MADSKTTFVTVNRFYHGNRNEKHKNSKTTFVTVNLKEGLVGRGFI